MGELYAIALFDKDGVFHAYVRKGRNNSIVGYDNITSAKRGLSQTVHNNVKVVSLGYSAKLVVFEGGRLIDE